MTLFVRFLDVAWHDRLDFRHGRFAAQVDRCFEMKMDSEEIYQRLSRSIDNVCLGPPTSAAEGVGIFPRRVFRQGPNWGNGEIAAEADR